ncbi:orotate phosphoribosyltransferase [Sesbania bispinosa]|nr:orotate phosphoribosyltransferase [Sesbania bispinosa]
MAIPHNHQREKMSASGDSQSNEVLQYQLLLLSEGTIQDGRQMIQKPQMIRKDSGKCIHPVVL